MRGHKKRRVDLQISATFHLPRGYQPSAALVREAVLWRLDNGTDHAHVKIRIVGWNTSDGKTGGPAGAASENEAFRRFAGVLKAAEYGITSRD